MVHIYFDYNLSENRSLQEYPQMVQNNNSNPSPSNSQIPFFSSLNSVLQKKTTKSGSLASQSTKSWRTSDTKLNFFSFKSFKILIAEILWVLIRSHHTNDDLMPKYFSFECRYSQHFLSALSDLQIVICCI